jgi:EF hand
MRPSARTLLLSVALLCCTSSLRADALPIVGDVEGQPLAANAERLMKALEFLGAPLPEETATPLKAAIQARDAKKIQESLDPRALVQVTINPEARVKVARGPAPATIQQAGFVPFLIKVVNDSTVKKPLAISSPQAGDVFGGRGMSAKDPKYDPKAVKRFLHLELSTSPPMTPNLSGLKVEYCVGLIYSTEPGKREVTLAFDIGQGTQDLGFRAEVPVLFEVRPGIPVKLSVTDFDGKTTAGRFTFKDAAGHVYPPRSKRLRPDFFFQDQVYRADGGTVLLPPGELTMTYGRGPEYRLVSRKVKIPEQGDAQVAVKVERWVNPMDFGFYNGDHHIHAAGCAHYTSPTEGVFPEDMFLHVKGEGMNVGCCLTWGPCYDFQRQFFEPGPHKLSEPLTLLKYDVEVSGFGSQALGHVCLLNLRDQTYPGSEGTKIKGWPTWTTPLMRWAKEQGAVTGYAHSANGLTFDPPVQLNAAARGVMEGLDANKDGKLSADEAAKGILPEAFATIDANGDGVLTADEITASIRRVKDKLPNYAIPPMNGIGAQEICVTSAMKVCDFISAMDTQRVPEWNCWYHVMNCGFPLKASGETDFPCINGSRVGMGRVYVQLGKVDKIDFGQWCEAIRKGASYVSDGYAHALQFTVNDKVPGDDVALEKPGTVAVKAKVAFASAQPLGTADGGSVPAGTTRKLELVVNGVAVASKDVPADDQAHDVEFTAPIDKSSWVALRYFPSLHTNPVNVVVGGKPIRASRKSANWCIGTIEQLWRVRGPGIAANERAEAEKTFKQAIEIYKKIAQEAAEGS